MTPLTQKMPELTSTFEREGYIVLPGMISKAKLAELSNKLRSEFARAKEKGELFSGGGTISGHLNCFPGAESRFRYLVNKHHWCIIKMAADRRFKCMPIIPGERPCAGITF